jgi:hypothetical protein
MSFEAKKSCTTTLISPDEQSNTLFLQYSYVGGGGFLLSLRVGFEMCGNRLKEEN